MVWVYHWKSAAEVTVMEGSVASMEGAIAMEEGEAEETTTMTTKMTTRFLVATTISDPFYFDSVGGLKPPRVGRTY